MLHAMAGRTERVLWGAAAVAATVAVLGFLLPALVNAHSDLGLVEAAAVLLLLGWFLVVVVRAVRRG